MSDHGPAQTLGVITHSGEPDELLAPLFSELFYLESNVVLFLSRVLSSPFGGRKLLIHATATPNPAWSYGSRRISGTRI